MSEQEPAGDQVRSGDGPTGPTGPADPVGPADKPATGPDRPGSSVSTRTDHSPATKQRTRIGAAWVAVAVAVIVLVLLLIFILQNQKSVTVVFFGAQGQLPLGVLVLLAAAGGALLVIVLGAARMIQLQWQARKDRRAYRNA